MIELCEELYPTFRWFLYDARQRYATAITIFGLQRAVVYLGQMYLVLSSELNQLSFEGSDNVTHLLVANFFGTNGQDLDLDDDGTLDEEPWLAVVDAIGLRESASQPPTNTEWAYGGGVSRRVKE